MVSSPKETLPETARAIAEQIVQREKLVLDDPHY